MARLPLTDLLDTIRTAIEERRYDDGAAIARLILESFPDSLHARRMLGEALWENGMPDEAAAAFEAVLGYDPEDYVAHAGLGLIAEQQGAVDRAISHLQRAAELAPNSEEVRGELLRLYERKGQADSSKLKISRAALARIYARSEMPSRAITELHAVLDDQPDRHDIRLALAELLWRDGQAAEAREQAETILQYLPDSVKAKLILAAAAAAEGQGRQAEQLLEQARAVDPLGEFAERLFGAESPLAPADPLLEVPDYLLGSKGGGTTGPDLDLELPDWLTQPASEPELASEPSPEADTTDQAVETDEEEAYRPETVQADRDDNWLRELRQAAPASPSAADPSPNRPRREPAVRDGEAAEFWEKYQTGDLPGALAGYQQMVGAEQDLEDVIQALTIIVADSDDLDATELLGDAHVRAGHFRAALDAYRRVLARLES